MSIQGVGSTNPTSNTTAEPTKTKEQSLGKDAFLQLLVTQMTHQDPTQPKADGEFIAQGPMYKGVRLSMGPTAVLRVGGIRVLVTTHNIQVYDLQVFLSQKIDPRACSVVAVKSWHHFRAAFEPISRGVMLADSGGLVSRDPKGFTYRKIRRPIYPLDLD